MLGGFALYDGKGAELSLPTRKDRALLSYLVLNADRPQPRERLMALLWSDRSERQARQSLNQALMSIRHLNEEEGVNVLDSDGERVVLHGHAVESDVHRLRLSLDDNPIAAATLYEGPFLDGLSIPDRSFQEWLTQTRLELDRLACVALERAANIAAGRGDVEGAINFVRHQAALDPLNEDAHRRLMRLLYQTGDRSGALRQYQICMQALEKELQVGPDAQTQALFAEIGQSADATTIAGPSPSIFDAPPALTDKPSIAVLPLLNLSGDPNQDYFADGITEDIITALARFPSLHVIARNSSFAYRGQPVDVKQIGRELGVRYVLEGSIRKAGKSVRITGQLIQADNGIHIWAERYDGNLTDVFALQDTMAASVVGAVVPSLQSAEIRRARRKPPDNHDAYDLYLRALSEFYAQSQESTKRALQLVEQALERDPKFVTALILGENCWSFCSMQGWIAPETAQPEAMRYARLAVQIDNNDADALATLARRLCAIDGDYEGAIQAAERAVSLNPNSAFAWRQSGFPFLYSGQSEKALEYFQRALRLSPRDPRFEDCWTGICLAFIQMERDSEAVAAGRKAVQSNPNSTSAWRVFSAALALNGQLDEASAAVQSLLSIDPDCTLTASLKRIAYTEKARARYFEGMRRAGLSD